MQEKTLTNEGSWYKIVSGKKGALKMYFFDFHTHPYIHAADSIKRYKDLIADDFAAQKEQLFKIGIRRIAGSVLLPAETEKARMEGENRAMYALYDAHPDFYVPGLRINPLFPAESLAAVEEAAKKGVRLIGELTPYITGKWKYTDCADIFDLCQEKGMVISCHPTENEDMTAVCRMFPRLTFVFAHPGEQETVEMHIERMKACENAYLDLSGTGIFRLGVIRHLIDKVGAERILFGSDFPICNPGVYTGGILYETLTEEELTLIAHKNAERLLGL